MSESSRAASEPFSVTLRAARPEDITSLERDVVAISPLAAYTGFALTEEELHRHTFGDPDVTVQDFIVAEAQRRVVGFVVGVHRHWKAGRETTAFIKLLMIHPSCHETSVGAQLLAAAETAVRPTVTKLEFGSCSPTYLLPGVPEQDSATATILRQAGWKASSERLSLFLDIGDYAAARKVKPKHEPATCDFALKIAPAGRHADVTGFIDHHFSVSWARETLPALEPGRDGFCAIAVCRESDDILGFAAVGASNPGWFGPMGIHPQRRGEGIGRQLFDYSARIAGQRGMRTMVLSWVNDKASFYSGIAPRCRLQTFRKWVKIL